MTLAFELFNNLDGPLFRPPPCLLELLDFVASPILHRVVIL